MWLERRRKADELSRLPMRGAGSPNTPRHAISTELRKRGAPGHSGTGTNRKNYRRLRPDYLRDLVAGVEDHWLEIGQFTAAHLRYQRDTNIIGLAAKLAGRK